MQEGRERLILSSERPSRNMSSSMSFRVVEAYLGNPRPQKRPDQELEPLQFRLDDDKSEVGLGVDIARFGLDERYLTSTAHQSLAVGLSLPESHLGAR